MFILKLMFQKGALRHLESTGCDNLPCWGNNNNTITITYQFLRLCVKINYHLPRWRRDRSSPIFTLWKMIKLFLIPPCIGCGCLPTPRALSCESRTKYAHKSSKAHSLLIRLLTTQSFRTIWLNNDPNPYPDRDEPGGENDRINPVGLIWAFSTPIVGALMDILTRQVVRQKWLFHSWTYFHNHSENVKLIIASYTSVL